MLEQSVLAGRVVRLEPLGQQHVDGIRAAADADRSTFGFTSVPRPETAESYVERNLNDKAAGQLAPFAQIEVATDRVIGHTSLANPFYIGDRMSAIEIGRSWLTPATQGTAINSESKLLLLTHAFEVWKVDRVQICTDRRNERSRAAITAIGGVFEGILRNYGWSNAPGEEGRTRDTAIFSIVADEWPATRQRLVERVSRKL